MKLEQIKDCAKKGIIVHYANDNYIVEYWQQDNFVVTSLSNNHSVGLTYKSDPNKCTHDLSKFYLCPFDCNYFLNTIKK